MNIKKIIFIMLSYSSWSVIAIHNGAYAFDPIVRRALRAESSGQRHLLNLEQLISDAQNLENDLQKYENNELNKNPIKLNYYAVNLLMTKAKNVIKAMNNQIQYINSVSYSPENPQNLIDAWDSFTHITTVQRKILEDAIYDINRELKKATQLN